MSPQERQPPRREPLNDELSRAREGEFGTGRELHATEHPVPPAEGKWRGVLARVRGLFARRRRSGS